MKFALLLLVAGSLLAGCGTNEGANQPASGNAAGNAAEAPAKEHDLAGKRIALVMQFNTGTFSAQYVSGVKSQVEKLGGQLQVFASDNDLSKMSSNLDAAVNQKFDGILLDHGTAQALEPGVKKAVDAKIPVVSFDSDLKVPGVTVLEQGDQKMAELTLGKLAEDIGGKGNIVKIWVAGFAPMERRQLAYKAFMDAHPDIKEIAAFGTVSNNTALDIQSQMEAILKQYPKKGDISAVWASYDEFAKGAARAIQAAGRDEIKIYGIDLSDEDLKMIQDSKNPWVASAAVDPADIGRIQVRYLYQKLHGDTTDDKVVLEPVFVSRDQLPAEPVTTDQLSQHVKGWGGSEQGYTDWLKELEN
ncbi:sugar ABC transporter substrate-binding protein [Paenibacillus gansuensis]|uniref:Sugar ABC transporter substrate-binding protein n=1 Tax=Paenibacillus gansuensis TaxID=306542 RepID=A0ABW5PCI9_9BACL